MKEMTEEEKTNKVYTKVLTVARELFAENGFRDTTVRMICNQAGVNVASVNYYFRSKEKLYEAIFKDAFMKLGRPLEQLSSNIIDQKTWEEAVDRWVTFMLTLFLSDETEYALVRRLVARERNSPSVLCEQLYNDFFLPTVNIMSGILKKAIPDADKVTFKASFLSILNQCSSYMNRLPPWDDLLVDNSISREDWIAAVKKQILANIFARYSFASK